MSIDVRAKISIERKREVVGSVMFNPKCDKLWKLGLSQVFPLTSGLFEKGSKVEHVGEFMSRKFSGVFVVTRCEENKMIEFAGEEPFQTKIRYDLDDAESGTDVAIRVQSVGEIPYNSPATILNRAVQEKLENELKKLKQHCEKNVE
jgi:hypothetical protein